MRRRAPLALALVLTLVVSISAALVPSKPDAATLRARGPAALDQLLKDNADRIQAHIAGKDRANLAAWHELSATIDAVAQQKDACASGLFWYTNFDEATAVARRDHKPILSLRLLGRLDEDLSCANSRYFRTTLYPDSQIAPYLRDHFVLHWQTVRPAPVITIDFGDGRTIRRTITGNSIHYVMTPDGRVVDGLPGLYGPQAFLRHLKAAEEIAQRAAGAPDADAILRDYHDEQARAEVEQWKDDLVNLKLIGLDNEPKETLVSQFSRLTDDATWTRIGQLHADDAKLSPEALALLASKRGGINSGGAKARDAGRLATAKTSSAGENLTIVAVTNLSVTIPVDTVRNEYTLHRRLHEFLAQTINANRDSLNTWVYRELFLMPPTDPWLGLSPPDVYSALDNEGVSVSSARP
jgi:hypothetical protein